MAPSPTIIWFRRDLRLADNPALRAALDRAQPVLPLYIHAPNEEAPWQPGAASHCWLHHSLKALDEALTRRGARLIIRKGDSPTILRDLITKTNASAVYWNRLYDPATIQRDTHIKATLQQHDIECRSFNSALLFEPWTIEKAAGGPFQVFTPYWKHCTRDFTPPDPLPAPRRIPFPAGVTDGTSIEDLQLLPRIPWNAAFNTEWSPGERGARANLKAFLATSVRTYASDCDRPDKTGTSRLSPHLHFGEISPRQIWSAARTALEVQESAADTRKFLSEVGWREFSHHLLYHFPHTTTRPLRKTFNRFPWREDNVPLKAWQQGLTGYPIVDAGMRELWTTGWMHNRVRMIVASFLVKHLLIPWQEGARWFWDTLVDADLAANTMGWQWTAGCGADAAPFFRIFNPMLQGAKFDPRGDYVRKWVPEIAKLPTQHLNTPWQAPATVLKEAAVKLGTTYPEPVVDHARARARALAAFESIRNP